MATEEKLSNGPKVSFNKSYLVMMTEVGKIQQDQGTLIQINANLNCFCSGDEKLWNYSSYI